MRVILITGTSKEKSTKSTGPGLSFNYDIVKVHDGELKGETKEGEYTKFTIVFHITKPIKSL